MSVLRATFTTNSYKHTPMRHLDACELITMRKKSIENASVRNNMCKANGNKGSFFRSIRNTDNWMSYILHSRLVETNVVLFTS